MIGTCKPSEDSHQSNRHIKEPRFVQPRHRPTVYTPPGHLFSLTKRHQRPSHFHFFSGCTLDLLESGLRVEGFQLVKSRFDTFKSRFRFSLITFISRTVQIGYCTVQLLQSRTDLLAFFSTQTHAAVLLECLDRGPDFHGRVMYAMKILRLNGCFHVFDQLLNIGPCRCGSGPENWPSEVVCGHTSWGVITTLVFMLGCNLSLNGTVPMCILILHLQQEFWADFTGLGFPPRFSLRLSRGLSIRLGRLFQQSPHARSWYHNPSMASPTSRGGPARYNGKRSDGIRPTPSPAPPWTGQAVAVSSRTFSRPFFGFYTD